MTVDGLLQLPLIPWSPPMPPRRSRANTHALYDSSNDLGIPDMLPETFVPDRLAAFHDRRSYGAKAAVHFFIDDYRFEPLWANPAKYVESFVDVGAIMSPDFSVYSDDPLAVQLWQTYRSRWVGAHFQSLGLRVIPTVGWATPADFHFYGIPRDSVLAVATTGVRRTPEGVDYFLAGFRRLEELEPRCVLVYGGLDGIVDSTPFEVREYPSFLDERRQRMEGE